MVGTALASLLSASLLVPPAPTAPDIARNLPPTWPPPGWPTRVTLPGESAAGTQATASKKAEAPENKWVDVFPHVRINRAQKSVEFDGIVAWDFHDADAPRTELELLVCLPMRDKEHESLVQSKAKGAHVHAALLMLGLEPVSPGRIDFGEGKDDKVSKYAPVGPLVKATFIYVKDGKEVTADPRDWFTDEIGERAWEEQKRRRAEEHGPGRRRIDEPERYPFELVFGGSKIGPMRDESGNKVDVYFADATGALIGLCTFGSEVIGNNSVVSPDSGVDVPRFVAKNDAIPPANTPVRVRVEQVPAQQLSRTQPVGTAGSNKTPAPGAQQPPNQSP